MIGHAYLWDPLFLAWGVALAIGLFASRGRDATVSPERSIRPASPGRGSSTETAVWLQLQVEA